MTKRKGPKPGTKPTGRQSSVKLPTAEQRAFVAGRTAKKGPRAKTLPPNLEGIEQPWYAALKAAQHATPAQHAAAAAALDKRDPWDEVRR